MTEVVFTFSLLFGVSTLTGADHLLQVCVPGNVPKPSVLGVGPGLQQLWAERAPLPTPAKNISTMWFNYSVRDHSTSAKKEQPPRCDSKKPQ